MWLAAILIAVPLIEIFLFIEIGGQIGTWPTIGIVVLTAVVGSVLLRQQGLGVLRNAQSRLTSGEDPGRLLADGVLILFAGALLLTPGFFTDAVGFALLVPPVRGLLWDRFAARVRILTPTGHPTHSPRSAGGSTIDGEYEAVDPSAPPSPEHRGTIDR